LFHIDIPDSLSHLFKEDKVSRFYPKRLSWFVKLKLRGEEGIINDQGKVELVADLPKETLSRSLSGELRCGNVSK